MNDLVPKNTPGTSGYTFLSKSLLMALLNLAVV